MSGGRGWDLKEFIFGNIIMELHELKNRTYRENTGHYASLNVTTPPRLDILGGRLREVRLYNIFLRA